MIKCPTCKRQAAPKARYCPACYTVFPSDALAINRRARGGGAGDGIGGAFPYLFFVAILVAWYLSIDVNAWNAEPGSYAATSRDIKRKVNYWFEESTNGLGESPATGVLDSNERPAWSIDNDSRLPCAVGATCKLDIRFGPRTSASYLVERPDRGAARIIAVDSRGADLLSKSTGAELVVPEGGPISISRTTDGWTIAGGGRAAAAATSASRASANEGVGP